MTHNSSTQTPRGCPPRPVPSIVASCMVLVSTGAALADAGLPFEHKLTFYRDKEGDTIAFCLLLEQPFLAEEFERSNYLRLHPLDQNAHLVYPKETRFEQKHAAFYGRLRGSGTAKLRLEYETVTENLDGSKRVQVQQGEIEIPIPPEQTGIPSVFKEWAGQQNEHFRRLLAYYPTETFLQYVLLQSKDRYGVQPPSLPKRAVSDQPVEEGLYQVVTGSLAIQQSLQQQTLKGRGTPGDLTIHISELAPPALRSLPYEDLLQKKKDREGVVPQVPELARLVPADNYMLRFRSMEAAGELFDLSRDWGDNLLRLFRVEARNSHLQEKFEEQLLIRRDELSRLFGDQVVDELVATGSDLYFSEGADVTLILRLKNPEAFDAAVKLWWANAAARHSDMVEREFNYRGQRVEVRYTPDREVSSFLVRQNDTAICSNSHVAIRRVIDTYARDLPSLRDADDFKYVSTIMPPTDDDRSGYFYASEAFLKRQVGPAMKISEKRRKQCFNNLVMLSNASMFYRLEFGRSPESLNTLIEHHFIDADKLICPHGGTYTFDASHDVGTCSLHNRLKYMTPNVELDVLRVSNDEQQEYLRYKQRYADTWQPMFDPIAVRVQVGQDVRLECCALPLANGGDYQDLKRWLAPQARDELATPSAATSVATVAVVLDPREIGTYLRSVPGIPDVLSADPTLTDLSWLGERVALHVCDADQIVQVDPQFLRPLNLFGDISVARQSMAALAITATSLPTYVTIEVRDGERAQRFLDLATSRVLLRDDRVWIFDTECDAYRLPDYKQHANYVLSFRLYALKLRIYVSLVHNRLVAATTLDTLQRVIDATEHPAPDRGDEAQMMMQLNLASLHEFKGDLEQYWAEGARRACHDNIMSIYNLMSLYQVAPAEVDRLSESKYGVTYYCPEGGTYQYDAGRDEVLCSVHGNRQHSRQDIGLDRDSSFGRCIDELRQIEARLRFSNEALLTTVTIERKPPAGQARAGD